MVDEETRLKLGKLCRDKVDEIRAKHCQGWRGGSGGPVYFSSVYPNAQYVSSTTLADGSDRVDIITARMPSGHSRMQEPSIEVRTSFSNNDEFWAPRADAYAKEEGSHRIAVIEGQWLTIGGVKYPARGDGFGGGHFRIKFNDGTVVDTRDLWSGGVIPPAWREKIPNNAEFLTLNRVTGNE